MSNPAAETSVDVAIIGLGSAGEALASTLASAGRTVVGFEPGLVGGECPFLACMPSKALLHHAASPQPVWPVARAHRDDVVEHLDDTEHHDRLVEAGVEVVRARAAVTGERLVTADGRTWRADHVVIATGSDPVIPPVDGLDHERVWTSDAFMTAERLPESLVVIGGGAIGCETASIMAGFGRRVALVEAGDALLAGSVDPLVSDLLGDQLRRMGVDVHLGAEVSGARHDDGSSTVVLGAGSELTATRVMVAAGQAPNWAGLGLDRLGVGDDPEVDDLHRVAGLEWLRAIGDVDGRSPWTHGANHEAARLGELLLGREARDDVDGMPNCVFTAPPVASVGQTVAAATADGLDVVTGMARYSDVARFSTDQLLDGAVVVVADRADGRIVGASGIGAHFDDIVSVVTAWRYGGVTVDRAARMVIPFPTMAQVLTVAAEAAAEAR